MSCSPRLRSQTIRSSLRITADRPGMPSCRRSPSRYRPKSAVCSSRTTCVEAAPGSAPTTSRATTTAPIGANEARLTVGAVAGATRERRHRTGATSRVGTPFGRPKSCVWTRPLAELGRRLPRVLLENRVETRLRPEADLLRDRQQGVMLPARIADPALRFFDAVLIDQIG